MEKWEYKSINFDKLREEVSAEAYITHSDERIVQGDFSKKREGAVVYTFDRKLKTLSWGFKGTNLGIAHCH